VVVADQFGDEHLAGRVVHHRDETEQHRNQVDVPDLGCSGQREETQRGREGCRRRLGDHQQPALRVAIGDHPAEQAEDQHRQELQGDGDADRGDAPAQLEDQPVLRDPLHPQSGGTDDLGAEEEPVVAYGQGGQRVRPLATRDGMSKSVDCVGLAE
jgi:hypothetical protein